MQNWIIRGTSLAIAALGALIILSSLSLGEKLVATVDRNAGVTRSEPHEHRQFRWGAAMTSVRTVGAIMLGVGLLRGLQPPASERL